MSAAATHQHDIVEGASSPASQEEPSDLLIYQGLSLEDWQHLLDSGFLPAQDVKPSSKRTYRRQLIRFYHWLQEEDLLQAFTQKQLHKPDIIRYREGLLEELAVSTVCGYLAAVRLLMSWLHSEGHYPHNAAAGVKNPRQSRGHKKDILTQDQLRDMAEALQEGLEKAQALEEAEEQKQAEEQKLPEDLLTAKQLVALRDKALFQVMARTGIRTIEASRATLEDLRQEAGEAVLYVHGKGRHEADEFVLLQQAALKPLRMYLAARRRLEGDLPDNAPLFASHSRRNRGEGLSSRTISRIIKQTMREVGIDDKRLTAHSLRHTAITLAILNGAAPEDAQAMARHRSLDTTMGYYHNLQRLERAAEKLITF